MAGKKYTGPERRDPKRASRRRGSDFEKTGERSDSPFLAPDRRRRDRNVGRLLRREATYRDTSMRGVGASPPPDYSPDRRIDEHGRPPILEQERRVGSERRLVTERRYGAGRRSGDLSRALDTGESIIFDMSKMKSTVGKLGKLAKKAGKHVPVIGTAIGLYDLVNRAKQ